MSSAIFSAGCDVASAETKSAEKISCNEWVGDAVELERRVNEGVCGVGGVPKGFAPKGRILVWFSCGAASAVAAKMAVEKYRETDVVEVLYCDTLKYEHPDNPRFMADVARWIGREIKLLRSEKYSDIFDVFNRTGWLIGVNGARCTAELKRAVRKTYQQPEDTHVFGLTADEGKRIALLEKENPTLFCDWILQDAGVTKRDCYQRIIEAGIAMPEMYRLGYHNNNCIGCVKGQMGYWNKIRRDFPEAFARMAVQERKMNVAICKTEERVNGKRKRIRVFLDELPPDAGKYDDEPDFECGAQCVMPVADEDACDGKLFGLPGGGGGVELCDVNMNPKSPTDKIRSGTGNAAPQQD